MALFNRDRSKYLHCTFTSSNFFNLLCQIRVTGLDGQPIHRASQLGAIAPADLKRCFLKIFHQCKVIPNSSNWSKRLDQDSTKTAEELEAIFCQDS